MVDGSSIRFHYRRQGAKGNPTLLLLHGFMGSLDDWTDEITEPLLASGLQLLWVDLPGHGRTIVDDEDDYFIEYCAPGLVRLLDQLQLKKVHLLGYSMGGRLALYMAVRYPERCDRIVLESASPGLKTLAERKARIAEDARLAVRMISQPMGEFLREWYSQPLFASMSTKPARLERLIARRMGNDPQGLVLSLQGMGTGSQPSLWNELANIGSSLLLIAGEKDSKFCSIGREMVRCCPGATLEIVPDVGHNVHFERSREFTELVQNFLHD